MIIFLQANTMALYLNMNREHLKSGIYAKNALLVGAWIVDSLDLEFSATGNCATQPNSNSNKKRLPILLFLSAAVLTPTTLWVESCWRKRSSGSSHWWQRGCCLPSLLIPANAVVLATVVCAKVWNLAMVTQVEFADHDSSDIINRNVDVDANDASVLAIETIDDAAQPRFLVHEAILNSLSCIFFVKGNDGNNTVVTGILVLIGVLFCSRIIAASLVGGAFVSNVLLGYLVFGESNRFLDEGSFGFNPALSAAGVFYFLVPSWKLTGLAVFLVIATVMIQAAVDVVLEIL